MSDEKGDDFITEDILIGLGFSWVQGYTYLFAHPVADVWVLAKTETRKSPAPEGSLSVELYFTDEFDTTTRMPDFSHDFKWPWVNTSLEKFKQFWTEVTDE